MGEAKEAAAVGGQDERSVMCLYDSATLNEERLERFILNWFRDNKYTIRAAERFLTRLIELLKLQPCSGHPRERC
jgi:hypothetical protein